MSANNRVIWSEGLFLQPQHFQQQERYVERFVEARCQALVAPQLGLHRDRVRARFPEHRQGRLAARRRGVPRRHAVPDARRRSAAAADRHRRRRPRPAALPGRARCAGAGESEAERKAGTDELVRHDVREVQMRNATAGEAGEAAVLEVGALRTRLLLARDVTAGLRLHPARAHRRMPRRISRSCSTRGSSRPCCTCGRRARLAAFATELLGLLHQRGEALGGRVAATGRGAAAEFADFLMLQAINRYEPLWRTTPRPGDMHPETFFRFCVTAAGRARRRSRRRRSGRRRFPDYRHDHLRESFEPGDRRAAGNR